MNITLVSKEEKTILEVSKMKENTIITKAKRKEVKQTDYPQTICAV